MNTNQILAMLNRKIAKEERLIIETQNKYERLKILLINAYIMLEEEFGKAIAMRELGMTEDEYKEIIQENMEE